MTDEEQSREDGRRDKLNMLGIVRAAVREDGASMLFQIRAAEDKDGTLVSMATLCAGLLQVLASYTGMSPEDPLDHFVEDVIDP